MDSTALAPVLAAVVAAIGAVIAVARFKPDMTATAVQTMGEVNDELRQERQDLLAKLERLEAHASACREQKRHLEGELRSIEEELRMCRRRGNLLEQRLQDCGKGAPSDR